MFPSNAHCNQKQFKVINVKNIVRMDKAAEKEYKDYIISMGQQDGAKVGGTLMAHRQVIRHSEVDSIPDMLSNTPIGKLKIISVEKDGCVARLVSVEKRDKNPLPEYNTVMIGDIVTIVKEVKKPEVVILPEMILFDFDKYNLKKEARTTLNKLAKKIKKSNYKVIEIASHTDSIGSHKYNQWLSKKRAESIYNYFVKTLRMPKKLFTVKGYGETKPIASNKTKGDRQKNRRGEITFYKE
jgi:outer membrane protein OmpA-like peptidoglycan-associated protein